MSTKRKTAYFKLLLVTLIWGAALPIVKPALSFVTPYQFLFLRFLIATPFLLPILTKQKHRQAIVKNLPLLTLFGLVSTVILIVLYLGLEQTTSLEASFIGNLQPLFITFCGILLLHEREEPKEWTGLLLALIGTSLIILEPLIHGKSLMQSPSLTGNLLITIFVILDSSLTLAVKRWAAHLDKILVTAFNSWVGMIGLFFLLLFTNNFPTLEATLHPNSLLAYIYMGTIGTVLAFRLIYDGFQDIEASEASLFSYLKPLIYIPLGVLWLHEPITLIQVFGLLLAFVGVLVAERR